MQTNRLILLFALGLVVIMIWQAWQRDYGGQTQPQTAQQAAQDPSQAAAPAPSAPAPSAPATSTDGSTQAPPPAPTAGETQAAAPTTGKSTTDAFIDVQTDVYHARINLNGGVLSELDLIKYPLELDKPDKPYPLLDNQFPRYYVIKSGLIDAQQRSWPLNDSVFQSEQTTYDMGDEQALSVTLTWTGENGVKIIKRFHFTRGSYVVTMDQEIVNESQQPWAGGQFLRIEREHQDKGGMLPTYTGAALYTQENKFEKYDFDDVSSYKEKHNKALVLTNKTEGWGAMLEHYFVSAIIPDKAIPATYFFDTNYSEANPANQRYWVGLVTPQKQVQPGGQATFSVKMFLGPKLQDQMTDEVAPGLVLTVDYGFLTVLSDPLFWLMDKIHTFVQNWGWSIVLVTLIIKIVFYPLSAASYRSMANMRKLTPKIQSLRERYKDDRQRMSQEMMDLYRKEKINPLGGCLPIAVQIPVFLALYWVLLESVELRQAPWILWINDLSTRDPYYVLPILMGSTMFLQQKLNPPQMDPTHQKIMQMLPVVFTLFTAFFPSGLVLYWLANNVLSIGQQWLITRSVEKGESPKKK